MRLLRYVPESFVPRPTRLLHLAHSSADSLIASPKVDGPIMWSISLLLLLSSIIPCPPSLRASSSPNTTLSSGPLDTSNLTAKSAPRCVDPWKEKAWADHFVTSDCVSNYEWLQHYELVFGRSNGTFYTRDTPKPDLPSRQKPIELPKDFPDYGVFDPTLALRISQLFLVVY